MFLRFKGLTYPTNIVSVSKRLVSNDIRKVLNTRLELPVGTNGNQIQLAAVSKNLNALNLDLFVNNLSQFEDRRAAVLDLVANLRATRLANTCLESTHFAVVRHLLENSTVQEVVSVLLDRQQYGIFLNNFTAFAVTQTLHNEGEYILGLSLVLKLVLLDEIESVFVQAFCLKSIIECLKKEFLSESIVDDTASAPTKGKVQEKKVRLKYLRNNIDIDEHREMGKAILKIAPRILEGNSRDNAMILGFGLTANHKELEKTINTKTFEINEDVSKVCQKLLAMADKSSLAAEIENISAKQSFAEIIDGLLKHVATEESAKLAEKQKELLPKWQQLREQTKLAIEREISEKERKQNIERMEKEIANKKELLWFFNKEDEIDLQIYNKRVYYPKRWFGKKKNPRVVDEHYVPPQIRRIN